MSSFKISFTQNGFTLVELVITITVISILAVIGYVAYSGMQTRAREAIVRSDLASAVDILNVDKARSGGIAYPDDINNADRGNGLPASDGTSYQYTVNNAASPPSFCLTAINTTVVMHVSENSYAESGACSGHTGI